MVIEPWAAVEGMLTELLLELLADPDESGQVRVPVPLTARMVRVDANGRAWTAPDRDVLRGQQLRVAERRAEAFAVLESTDGRILDRVIRRTATERASRAGH